MFNFMNGIVLNEHLNCNSSHLECMVYFYFVWINCGFCLALLVLLEQDDLYIFCYTNNSIPLNAPSNHTLR